MNPTRVVRWAVYILAIVVIVTAVKRAIPSTHIVIETGPVGGSYYDDALKYKQELQRRGIILDLLPNPDSLEIVKDVNAAANGSRVGFVAQQVDPTKFPNAFSIGAIELQPLFIFYSLGMGEIGTPTSLRGHRIVMPPKDSATSDAALRVLLHFGITPQNTEIVHMPIAAAAEALHKGQFDAGFFMLAPSNALIMALASDDNLRLLPMADVVTLSRLEPYLRPIVLPAAIYSMENDVPPADVPMLAATVNVIVRRDLDPAVLYFLLEAMADVHHGPSIANATGLFPNLRDTALPVHPLAREYEKSGIPWIYRELPLPIAGLVDSYLIIGVALFLTIEFYKSYRYLTELIDFLLENFWLRILRRIERRSQIGRGLRAIDLFLIRMAERALDRTTRRRRSEEVIRRIRQSPETSPTSH